MLSGKLPTGTVGEDRTDDRLESEASGTDPPLEASASEGRDRVAALEAEVEALERELARREAERREIIDRYESLLRARERDRVADGVEDESPSERLLGRVRTEFRRLRRRV